ncbi:MAG TPA: aconitase X catalytic domain-containing protein [Acidimicrobiia bacterium]|nr:aconitase X catalytic domain-containing protein [Acidimicrobiia bacterium]
MQLTDKDRAMLAGRSGEAVRTAMELLIAVAESEEAPALLDISAAHIDGGLYHGEAGLDFARDLVEGGGRVVVPTTMNVSSLDLLHPDLYRGDPGRAKAARALMEAYVAMGCAPTWTCAPYQLAARPRLGDQIAWGESNAIVFANSVLGARTARYGDFLDVCCALTGRAPATGLHTDEGRRATLRIDVEVPDRMLDDDLFYPALGYALGEVGGAEVAVITGLDRRAGEDRLKALGAAAASSGAVAMFHVTGVTPEAPTVEAATQHMTPARQLGLGVSDLIRARESLNHGEGPLGAISVGTPHFSTRELENLGRMVAGKMSKVPFYVNTSRDILREVEPTGVIAAIEAFGATIVTDTCTYITPIMGDVDGRVMTDSAKWAFYAPGNLGVGVIFAGIEACVSSAVSGRVELGEGW